MQRAKKNVLSFDDKNTKYFHDKVNYRKRRTQIECLKSNIGIWLTDKSMIATELREHFSKMSRTTNPVSDSSFLDVLTPCISDVDNDFLIHPPTDEEIKYIFLANATLD